MARAPIRETGSRRRAERVGPLATDAMRAVGEPAQGEPQLPFEYIHRDVFIGQYPCRVYSCFELFVARRLYSRASRSGANPSLG